MYKLSGVTKNYAKGRETVAALRGVDLVIEDGEWLAIQGPTGHGKSTLLQILGGLDRPSAGIVDFDGRDLTQLREAEVTRVRATSIGFVFQTFNLIPTLSAQENVEAALVPLHVSAAARQQRAAVALDAVGLGDRPGTSRRSGFGLPIWRLGIPSPPTNDQWRHSRPRCRWRLSHPGQSARGCPGELDNLFPLVNRN
jgi:ABC-type lipoprotein export system ATPase subunit